MITYAQQRVSGGLGAQTQNTRMQHTREILACVTSDTTWLLGLTIAIAQAIHIYTCMSTTRGIHTLLVSEEMTQANPCQLAAYAARIMLCHANLLLQLPCAICHIVLEYLHVFVLVCADT